MNLDKLIFRTIFLLVFLSLLALKEKSTTPVQPARIQPKFSGVGSFLGAASIEIPHAYESLASIEEKLRRFSLRYPDILHLEEIGKTSFYQLPIYAVRISDNAARSEDEPRALFTGVHHAREPIGAAICLAIIETLCREYGRNEAVTKMVNATEVWLVPVVNPDGYKYMFDEQLNFPWWRKNLKDNDGDGVFNPVYDGVDLNRNYDYNWKDGGDGKPGSWFYRGTAAFSESETRALMQLAERENVALGVSYHSYGESVLFPWGNYAEPPDLPLILSIANQLAARLPRQSGMGKYSILPLNGRVGQSSVWMYGHLGAVAYIVEVGTEYFPAAKHIPAILAQHVDGARFLLDRLHETGVSGHVFDRVSGEPLVAVVEVLEFAAKHVNARRSEPQFGRFHRLLEAGVYTVEISSDGYETYRLRNVLVGQGQMVQLEIALEKRAGAANGH